MVRIWEEERADLCTDKGPCHGAGIQLVNVIGKAVRLSGKRKEVKKGIKHGISGHCLPLHLCPQNLRTSQSLLFHDPQFPFLFLIPTLNL